MNDQGEETFGFFFPAPVDDEWKEVPATLDEASSDYHYGGEGDGRMAWPLRLIGICVVANPHAAVGDRFRLHVDDIRATIPDCDPIPIDVCDATDEGAARPWRLYGENLGETKVTLGGDEESGLSCTWLDYSWGPGNPRPNSFAELVQPAPLEAARGTVFTWLRAISPGPFTPSASWTRRGSGSRSTATGTR